MNSREAAEILQSTDVKDLFAENFGGGVEVKPRSYPVVVDHVPTSFRITLKTQELEYQVIEEHNNLPGSSIVDARWIKPPSRRSSTQTAASLALHLNSAQATNQVIRNGLLIANKRVTAQKMLSEPRRCFKCHNAGGSHLAAACPQDQDICGKCSGKHRTFDCVVSESSKMKCPACSKQGHAAGDVTCLVFQQQRKLYLSSNPLNYYRFY
ncbi:hypothetical protein M422DRAFT_162060, partial [Sphaerobolus stellatus SS14]